MLTNAEYLEDDPLEELTMRNVYIYYDEPILFSFNTKSGDLYVGNLIKSTVNYQRWLYIRVEEEDLFKSETGLLSLLECLTGSTYNECYIYDEYVDGSELYYKLDKGGLSVKDLPAEDFYIGKKV